MNNDDDISGRLSHALEWGRMLNRARVRRREARVFLDRVERMMGMKKFRLKMLSVLDVREMEKMRRDRN